MRAKLTEMGFILLTTLLCIVCFEANQLFVNFCPRETPVTVCSNPAYAMKFQMPIVPTCRLAGPVNEMQPVETNITTWWPTKTTKYFQGYECFGSKRYKRCSYILHLGYSRDNEIWDEPIDEKQCRDMLVSNKDPKGETLKMTQTGTWTSDRDYDLQYTYPRTVFKEWWIYTIVSRTIVLNSDSGLILSAASTATDCHIDQFSCRTISRGVLNWSVPEKACDFKKGPSETCFKLGDSVSCPGGLGWAFQDISIEEQCGVMIAKSGTNVYFTPDSEPWNKTLALTEEFDKVLKPRKVRQVFSPESVTLSRDQFLHNMYQNISNTLAFEIFQRTCQIYSMFLRLGIYEAKNGKPNLLLEGVLGPGYVGTMYGDVIGISKCSQVFLYKCLPWDGKCAVEWPIEIIVDGKFIKGWLTPGHEVIFSPTYVDNCRDYYFTQQGVSYHITEDAIATKILELPHLSNIHVPIDLHIPEVLPTAPGIYTRTDLTENANIYAVIREVRHASALQIAVGNYMEGEDELSAEDQSLLEELYNCTVKHLANKLTAFFATAGTLLTVGGAVAGLSALGLLEPLLDAVTGIAGPIIELLTSLIRLIWGGIINFIRPILEAAIQFIRRTLESCINFVFRRGVANNQNAPPPGPDAPIYPQLPVIVVPGQGN